MSPSSQSFAPFFEPGTAPPPLPLLTAQTDLKYDMHHPATIISNEELTHTRNSVIRTKKPPIRDESCQPYPRPSKVSFACGVVRGKDSSDSDSDSSDSSLSSLSSSDSDNEKIPKPASEAGRPGRGGYNLEDALDWDAKKFKHLKKCIHALVEDHLDTSQSYSSQTPSLIQLICNEALKLFPVVDSYSSHWPVTDLIKMHLKYTAGRARRYEQKMAAGKKMAKKMAKK